MTVRELMERLRTADSGATVLFLTFGADLDEAVETSGVLVDQRPWTHEEGVYGGGRYAVYYRGAPVVPEAGYTDVNTQSLRVVLLSDDADFLASRIADDEGLGE
jgi:hypothetical protein